MHDVLQQRPRELYRRRAAGGRSARKRGEVAISQINPGNRRIGRPGNWPPHHTPPANGLKGG